MKKRTCTTCEYSKAEDCYTVVGCCYDHKKHSDVYRKDINGLYRTHNLQLDTSSELKYKDEESTDGLKYDVSKVDFTYLQDWSLALAEICKLSEFGAKKYSRGGWLGIEDPERLKKAMLRHYFKEQSGTPDQDSGFMHDVAVAWNALGALEIRLRNYLE